MEAELIYVASYHCPHCNAELEVRQSDWPGWLRCPACARPSLPPELLSSPFNRRVEVAIAHDTGPIFSPLANENSENPPDFHPDSFDQPQRSSTPWLIFCTAFVVSAVLFTIYTWERDTFRMAIFGVVAAVSLLVLLRRGRSKNLDAN